MEPLKERIQNKHMIAIDSDSYLKLMDIQHKKLTSNIARPTIKSLLSDAIDLLDKNEVKNRSLDINELKKLINTYSNGLDNVNSDEYYGTPRDIFVLFCDGLLAYCNEKEEKKDGK
jgi:hypothetical protein